MLPLIIDVGNYSCKAGLSNAALPQLEIYKDESPRLKGVPIYPYDFVEHRKIIDPKRIAPFYEFMYNELEVKSEEHPVLLAETPGTEENFREYMAEIFFEKFQVPALGTSPDNLLSLYGSGITTGVVVDVGHRLTTVQSFCEGVGVPRSLISNSVGGKDLTDFLERLLTEVGFFCHTTSQKKQLRKIKESKAYVPVDYYQERLKFPRDHLHNGPQKVYYEMPDGTIIDISTQRFRCTEPIYDPNLSGSTAPPLPVVVSESIAACDATFKPHMWNNIVLTGGTTLLPGFIMKLHTELDRLQMSKVGLIAHDNRKYGAWIGGTMLSTCSAFKSRWLDKTEYDEGGPGELRRKKWY